jgi:hypothetical protein
MDMDFSLLRGYRVPLVPSEGERRVPLVPSEGIRRVPLVPSEGERSSILFRRQEKLFFMGQYLFLD